jgi:CBS domain-containing protein
MARALCAGDVMTRDVVQVPTTMDLRDLAKLFLERGITGAPVVDESGHLAGVISQTDLVYYNLMRGDELVLDSHFYQHARVEGGHLPQGYQVEDANSGIVADVMTPVVHSVSERASLDAVARLMTRQHIHRVIVRRGRRIAGVISALDILRARSREQPAAVRGTARAKKKSARREARASGASAARRGSARRRANRSTP